MQRDGRRLFQCMPSSVAISIDSEGISIRATRTIYKGEVIDPAVAFCFLENSDKIYDLVLTNRDETFPLHSLTNTLLYTDMERVCNGYVGFINHSCKESNVIFNSSNQFEFSIVARCNISPGEELTSNYLLFDYTCNGHEFQCRCDAGVECYRQITGFKSLPRNIQFKLLSEVTTNVLHSYVQDEYNTDELSEMLRIEDAEECFRQAFSPEAAAAIFTFDGGRMDDLLVEGLYRAVPEESNAYLVAAFTILLCKIRGADCIVRSTAEEYDRVVITRVGSTIEENIRNQEIYPHSRVAKYCLGKDTQAYAFQINVFRSIEYTGAEIELTVQTDFSLTWRYNESYKENMLISYNAVYLQLLFEMLGDPQRSIESLQLVSPTLSQKILDEWNQPMKEADINRFIFESVEMNAQKNPEKIAVESSGVGVSSKLTYRELVERMKRLACVIQSFPVQPDDVVGIMMPRDCDLIAALLGILKSGRAYTAVLPEFPESRIKYILETECKVKVIVTDLSYAAKFSWFSGHLIFMNRLFDYLYVEWTNNLSFSNLAYITYTSGSSGNPKGVMVEHGHLVMYTQQDEYNIDGDVYLHSTNVTFDIIVLEIYVPLVRNKSIYVVENLMVTPLPKVCFLQGPSSLLEYVPPDAIEVGGCVSQVGERITHDLVKKFDRISNGYGTAETVNISVGKLLNVSDDARIIGRPLSFSKIYILGKDLCILPPNILGEICIGGPCLARGYMNSPELTATKYILNPYGPGRLYRTGDLAMWTDEGEIMFHGRKDFQVKINGVRIELEEVEAVATSFSGVERAICTVLSKQLLLYWKGTADPLALEEFLLNRLPTYSVPKYNIQVPAFPLGSNGKINRRDLPMPSQTASEITIHPPRNSIEFSLVDIWRSVLGIAECGIKDRFFQIGGDSLRLVQLQQVINKTFRVSLLASDLYRNDTIESIGNLLNSLLVPKSDAPSTESGSFAGRSAYLSIYQQQLLLQHHSNTLVKVMMKSSELSPYEICSLVLKRFPILKTRLKDNLSDFTPGQRNLCRSPLSELVFVEDYEIEEYTKTTEPVPAFDLRERFSRCFVSYEENSIYFCLLHAVYDGYSLPVLFNFISKLLTGEIEKCKIEPENFSLTNSLVNNKILASYDRDIAYWERELACYTVGSRKCPMVKFDHTVMKNFDVFEMMKYINDIMPFSLIFYIESWNIRFDELNFFGNGCLLFFKKFSTIDSIRSKFNEALAFSSIPVYELLERFKLKNVIYINHSLVSYDVWDNLSVIYNDPFTWYDNYPDLHFPLALTFFGPEKFYCAPFETDFYFQDDVNYNYKGDSVWTEDEEM